MNLVTDHVWQTQPVIERYLTGVRGGIPLAAEQIRTLLELCRAAVPNLKGFLDLGCGDGILGRALLSAWPDARGVFIDFSEPMLAACKEKLGEDATRHHLRVQDYGAASWTASVASEAPFDVIVSGFSIHHQEDHRKRELYHELYHLLRPGGLFLNLEHVASASPWGEQVFDARFVESLVEHHRRSSSGKSAEEIAKEYYYRADKAANRLAALETQCDWLRELGYQDVDCFFKIYELALFGGRRPDESASGDPNAR